MTKSDCVWLFFFHILVSHVYLLWRKIYSLALFIFKSGYLSLLRKKSSLYSPAVKSIIKYMFYKLFSSLVGCVVFSSYDSLTNKSFHSYFFLLLLLLLLLWCSRSHCQIQLHKGSSSLSNPVSQRLKNRQQFYSSGETLICFALVLLWHKVRVWVYSLTCGYPSYPALLINRLFFTLLKDHVTLVKN